MPSQRTPSQTTEPARARAQRSRSSSKDALPEWSVEREHWEQGLTELVGVDEAGRGPLAGPVVAAAVLFDRALCDAFPEELRGLNDSKQLSPEARERYHPLILQHAASYGIGIVSAAEIDRMNILQATMHAMTLAVEELTTRLALLGRTPELLLIDGNHFRSPLTTPARTVVRGDARSPLIAAASVIAKVTRDRIMTELDQRYPEYGFAAHKGYGTAAHTAALERYGPTPEHRRSFRPERFAQLDLSI